MNWTIEDALRVIGGNLNPLFVWDSEKQEGHREEGLWKDLEVMNPCLKDALFTASMISDGMNRRTDWVQGRLRHIEPDNRRTVLDYAVDTLLKHHKDLALIWCYTACMEAEENDTSINPEWVSGLAQAVLTCTRKDWFDDEHCWGRMAKKRLAEYLAK